MAKVLGIEGSPRKGGNSDLLLDAFMEGASASGHETEKIYVCSRKIAPCDEENTCFKTGACRVKDEMQPIYGKLLGADVLVVSSPVFFMGAPAQLKAVIDRCQALWAKRFVLKKPLRAEGGTRRGYLLGVSGLNKKEAFTGLKETMKAFFHVLGFKYAGEVLVEGVDNKGDIKSRRAALDEARGLGKSV